MNIFDVHEQIINDYSSYIESFVNIKNDFIRKKVENEISSGKLWPQPLIQFNPFFKPGKSVKILAEEGILDPAVDNIFKGYNLYEHQVKAISLGNEGKDFIVTSGTGSGKSLTYLGTIFNYLLKNKPKSGVKAIIIYPMNALINSQNDEITRYKKNYEKITGKDFPITFGQYTGQEDENKRKALLEDLPDILLTNYMMLELIMTRVQEEDMRNSIFKHLKYIVYDELHTYRGRQGADVALLTRRIKSMTQGNVSCIGTSATMVSGTPLEQRQKVAEVGTTFFGNKFTEKEVITETLVSSLGGESTIKKEQVVQEITNGINIRGAYDVLLKSTFAKWLEENIALNSTNEGELIRNKPQTFNAIINTLATYTNLSEIVCNKAILDLLEWISNVNDWASKNDKKTILPFKLHQFISQTGSVYMTLDKNDNDKILTLEAGVYVNKSAEQKKPIFPVVFSRESGHEFICVTRNEEINQFEPREFYDWTVSEDEEGDGFSTGYLIPNKDVWSEDDLGNLPESWIRRGANGIKVVKKYRDRVPKQIFYNEYGQFSDTAPSSSGWKQGWYMSYKLLFDPTSGTFYDAKTSEGTKLTKLGSEGRSTSTTILSFNILRQLAQSGYDIAKQKLLSFTDNRQDAALQAGHFNDFIQTLHLRTAINSAVHNSEKGFLEFEEIGNAVFKELNINQESYAASPATFPGAIRENEDALKDYLVYKTLHDLKRSWRVILPNLEQCGLLDIGYKYLKESCNDDSLWSTDLLLTQLKGEDRKSFIIETLDFFRKSFAIRSAEYLADNKIETKSKRLFQKLKSPWKFEEEEKIPYPNYLRYDTMPKYAKIYSASIGYSSGYGRYLRNHYKEHLGEFLNKDTYYEAIQSLLDLLDQAGWLYSETVKNLNGDETKIYQLNLDMVLWQKQDSDTIKSDPIKTRSYKPHLKPANTFFKNIYKIDFKDMKELKAGDHTGQIGNDKRQEREKEFKSGELSALYCSPTMELGIDISSLDVVHMRNVPPNPANYAQRSGRAGRSGQAALIFTYCSNYSPHDKNYFKNSIDMVSGSVAAPKLELTNEELHKTHLNAMYLSYLGLSDINRSIADLVNEDDPINLPLDEVVERKIKTGLSEAKKNEIQLRFNGVVTDYKDKLLNGPSVWFTEDWIKRNISSFYTDFNNSINRWRTLYKSAKLQREEASNVINSGLHKANSPEYKEAERNQRQATFQIDLLRNDNRKSLSEFYPFRYFASEGFLPGYNFTRLPIRTYLQANDVGEYVSRPRFIAIREFGPKNIIYHNGKKFSIEQLIMREKLSTVAAKASLKSGYFLTGNDLKLDTCPLTGVPLSSDKTKKDFVNLVEMAETRGVQKDRISCDEEERASQGFNLDVYFSIPAGIETTTQAKILSSGEHLLNIRFMPSASLYTVNSGWRKTKEDSFRIGINSGFWKSSGYEPKEGSEDVKKVQLYTSDTADALYIQPVKALGLEYDGIVTLMYALKRAIEIEFQVESREISVVHIGDEDNPNILIYESAEGSLGVLSQMVASTKVFNKVVETAITLCKYDNGDYTAPASYDDLLSYYNQGHHLLIDRFLIKDKLDVLKQSEVEILSKASAHGSYEEHYETLLKQLDKTSSTEVKFLKFLYERGLKLPDGAQERHEDLYVMPDFHYEKKYWIFCDGTPHDKPEVKERDKKQRQGLMNKGQFPIVFYYKDNWEEVVSRWPNVFKKVK